MNTLVKWDPNGLVGWNSDIDRLFESFFGNRGADAGGHRRWTPAVDLVETESEIVLKADLPGVTEDDVTVELEDSVLTVSGERRTEKETRSAGGYYRVERSSGHFSRSVKLPEGIDDKEVSASFTDGVLEVRVPKPAERQPTRIPITRGTVLEASSDEDAKS